MEPKVDDYLSKVKKWQDELVQLRRIVLDCGLHEELKWKVPCYTINGGNVVLIHAFKDYCAVLFMKGSLLQDTDEILIQQTENVQSGRQIRFTSLKEILDLEPVVKTYIFQAIEVEKAGLKVIHKKTDEFPVPVELTTRLAKEPDLKKAFEALTPGRQRAYLLHFSAPKQSATRETRIDKAVHRIMKGKGLNDCICGLSKRMPNCDGSHKVIAD
jgi:uncharacterized protein YdeI (YjbR/CyaY-like superfamily)